MKAPHVPDASDCAGPCPGRKPRCLAALLIAAAIAVGGAGSQGAAAEPLETGITDPITTYDAPLLAYQRMQAAGARYVRLTIGWAEVAPRKKPKDWDPTNPSDSHYWWPNVDRQVINAVAAGLTPVIAITGAPSWGQGCDSQGYPGSVCNLDVAAFASFATAIARRYSGAFPGLPRVSYWQAQNEPNSVLFFNPQFGPAGQQVSADLYRNVLYAFSAAIKGVDPTNLVVSAGLAPLERPGTIGPLAFTRSLLCMSGRQRPKPTGGCEGGIPFDIFAINPYTTGGPTHSARGPDDVSLGDLMDLQRLLQAADGAHHIRGAFRQTPLWITEFSWDSNPPDPGGLPSKLHARWVSEALFRAWQAGVDVFFWYGLRDEERQGRPANQTVDSGLYLRGSSLETDQPKRSLEAFRFPVVALNRKGGFLVWGRTPNSGQGQVRIQVLRQGRWRPRAKLRAGQDGIFRAKLRTRTGRHFQVRAVYRKQRSVPFSLRYVEDFYQPPFG
jgi:hypothetical protein